MIIAVRKGFPGGSDGKESACYAGDLGLIPGSRRYLREGNGNSLQYSCLENSKDRGAWQATVHGVSKESDTTEQLTYAKSHGIIVYSFKYFYDDYNNKK